MSDIIDDANMQVELNELRSIQYSTELARKPIPKSDFCYWCKEKTHNGRRFCSAECRNMYQEFSEKL